MKELPHFADEKAEAEFWATHDSTEYLDNTEPVDVTFVDARVPKKLISVRFDNETIESLKTVARTKGIGYQTSPARAKPPAAEPGAGVEFKVDSAVIEPGDMLFTWRSRHRTA